MSNSRRHPDLPFDCQVLTPLMVAEARTELGLDLSKLGVGRHTATCLQCKQQRRNSPVRLIIDTRVTLWRCDGCGSGRSYSSIPSNSATRRAS
ncbi:MAG TPA: hypothetical protein VHL31_11330 [Geminicoccus sp.]|jgi:hypothetical protein|uniref:hypothetical protein n=1 Tax=Geminicoccus sp. TaxID=2024832 RepID=UPI002E3133B7|nr:hypothetical protein [Geminicoccus sp.]HEX2526872.1 hypothetical protein [Geminicoccus sp.]